MIETDLYSGTYDVIVIAPLQVDLVKTLISDQDIPIINLDTRIGRSCSSGDQQRERGREQLR